MLNIQQKLTPYNYTSNGNISRIKYIVIHWVGAVSTAKNNADYFASKYLGASAHYFVDEWSIWQSVLDHNVSWHCGGGLQGTKYHSYYQKCLNTNSIGIEVCVKYANGVWYFEDNTLINVVDLVKYLMVKYNVPISNVIRHADVTGKQCPLPYCYGDNNDRNWEKFKERLVNNVPTTIKDLDCMANVTATELNIRSAPSTDSNIIGKLVKGDSIYVTGVIGGDEWYKGGWYRADFRNSCGIGYVYSSYVELITESPVHSSDNTVNALITDGITASENIGYWEGVLKGEIIPDPNYIRTLFDRYHSAKK